MLASYFASLCEKECVATSVNNKIDFADRANFSKADFAKLNHTITQ